MIHPCDDCGETDEPWGVRDEDEWDSLLQQLDQSADRPTEDE
jgi:hypothetical protein